MFVHVYMCIYIYIYMRAMKLSSYVYLCIYHHQHHMAQNNLAPNRLAPYHLARHAGEHVKFSRHSFGMYTVCMGVHVYVYVCVCLGSKGRMGYSVCV